MRRLDREAAEALADIVLSSPQAIFTLALDGTVLTWNPGAEQLYGIAAETIIGRVFAEFLPEDATSDRTWAIDGVRRRESVINNEIQRQLPDGRVLDLSASMSPIFAPDGSVNSAAFIISDITPVRAVERRLAESLDELRETVFRDRLTGVGNRELLMQRLGALGPDSRDITVVVGDVDEFQYFNQTFGHVAADAILGALAAELAQLLDDDDILVRTGGDEFAVLAVGKGPGYGAALARRIETRLASPVVVGEHQHALTMGIGVAVASQPGPGLSDFLLRRADIAQYEAKFRGRGLWLEYGAEMEDAFVARTFLEERLRHAGPSFGDMRLVYQPLCDAQTGRVREVEALLRWTDPELGSVSPADFIPVAEQSGLIVPLGEWVLRTACRELVAMDDEDLKLNLNVSPRQLADAGFTALVAAVLAVHGIAAHRLVLEVTESVIVGSGETLAAELERLRALGVGLAVDDFGTGHSSLARLHALPFTTLKIDKSLIDGIGAGHGGDVIVKAVVGMAQGLSMSVVAEGVELAQQLDRLRELGCDLIQGFLLHRPLPPDELRTVLRDQAASDSRARAGRIPVARR